MGSTCLNKEKRGTYIKKRFCFVYVCPQVLRYFDYVFTGVFTFEMIIKVGKGK